MTKAKVTTAGFVTNKKFLNVHASIGHSGVTRYHVVLVSMKELAADRQFCIAFEKATAELLKGSWEEDTSLPGIDDLANDERVAWRECSPSCPSDTHES